MYLSIEELKGRSPSSWEPNHRRSRLQRHQPLGTAHCSGPVKREPRRRQAVFYDFGFARHASHDLAAVLAARGGTNWRKALWASPGASGQFNVLTMRRSAIPPRAGSPRCAMTIRDLHRATSGAVAFFCG